MIPARAHPPPFGYTSNPDEHRSDCHIARVFSRLPVSSISFIASLPVAHSAALSPAVGSLWREAAAHDDAWPARDRKFPAVTAVSNTTKFRAHVMIIDWEFLAGH
jgi:hypothetical protein